MSETKKTERVRRSAPRRIKSAPEVSDPTARKIELKKRKILLQRQKIDRKLVRMLSSLFGNVCFYLTAVALMYVSCFAIRFHNRRSTTR